MRGKTIQQLAHQSARPTSPPVFNPSSLPKRQTAIPAISCFNQTSAITPRTVPLERFSPPTAGWAISKIRGCGISPIRIESAASVSRPHSIGISFRADLFYPVVPAHFSIKRCVFSTFRQGLAFRADVQAKPQRLRVTFKTRRGRIWKKSAPPCTQPGPLESQQKPLPCPAGRKTPKPAGRRHDPVARNYQRQAVHTRRPPRRPRRPWKSRPCGDLAVSGRLAPGYHQNLIPYLLCEIRSRRPYPRWGLTPPAAEGVAQKGVRTFGNSEHLTLALEGALSERKSPPLPPHLRQTQAHDPRGGNFHPDDSPGRL